VLTFLPTKKHTYLSEVNLTKLPASVRGVWRDNGRIVHVDVSIKDERGALLPSAIPKVTLIKHSRYQPDDLSDDASGVVEVGSRIDKNLEKAGLAGFVLEGNAPYSTSDEPTMAALSRAALRGMPVARVGRGHHEGFTPSNPHDLFIEGSNLTATKARLLLMACLMKFGSLPLPSDPERPTEGELDAIRTTVASYQAVFDTH